MYSLPRRIGSAALVGAVALGVAIREAPAQQPNNVQGFRVGTGQPAAATGGVRGYVPPSGMGFNYSAYGAAPSAAPLMPYGSMMSSPYASMTSTGGGVGNGGTPYYSPYGYGYGFPDPFSGYLTGASNAINAQGQYLVRTQQAYLLKEQVRAAQLENRRRVFDEWLYERARTPTLNDERERIQHEELRRSRNEPPPTEIWSGKALNDLLANAIKLQGKKINGPDIKLDEDVVKKVNVSTGREGTNFGMLKNGSKLHWPVALRGLPGGAELRDNLQTLVKKAYDEARAGQAPDPGTFNEIEQNTRLLNNLLQRRVNEESFNDYNEAKAFLRQLDSSVRVLKQRDAANFINGDFAAKGGNVADLVRFMTEKGLQFAPATTGEHAAYIALYRALRDYDVGASSMAAER